MSGGPVPLTRGRNCAKCGVWLPVGSVADLFRDQSGRWAAAHSPSCPAPPQPGSSQAGSPSPATSPASPPAAASPTPTSTSLAKEDESRGYNRRKGEASWVNVTGERSFTDPATGDSYLLRVSGVELVQNLEPALLKLQQQLTHQLARWWAQDRNAADGLPAQREAAEPSEPSNGSKVEWHPSDPRASPGEASGAKPHQEPVRAGEVPCASCGGCRGGATWKHRGSPVACSCAMCGDTASHDCSKGVLR